MTSLSVTASERQTLATAYAADRAAVVRYRLRLTVALYLVFMLGGLVVAAHLHPDRLGRVILVSVGEVLACGLALAACAWPTLGTRVVAVAATLGIALAALVNAYNVAVAGPAVRLVLGHICLLSGFVVLLPWGWRGQF